MPREVPLPATRLQAPLPLRRPAIARHGDSTEGDSLQAKAAKPRTTSPAPLRRSNTSKGASFHITSESIAADLAAFRKQGGRIEVLGNTPLHANVSAFRSTSKTGSG